jgi:phosphoribosylaminoimidazole (AIR) synthetase
MAKNGQPTKKFDISVIKNMDILPTTENRRFIRHPLNIPLACKVIKKASASGQEGISGTTANVSLGGLLFSAKRPLEVGALVLVKMPFKDKIFNVKSKVVHCAKSSEAKLYNVGVGFYQISDAFKAKLIEQIYLIAGYRDLRSIQLGREVSLEEASKEWIERYAERFKRLYW